MSHMSDLVQYGDVPPKWVVFFHKKSLDMGPLFTGKTLRYGFIFQKFGCLPSKISRYSACEHPKILKNRPIFQEKSLEMATFFGKNDTQKRVRVSRLGRHTPDRQIKFRCKVSQQFWQCLSEAPRKVMIVVLIFRYNLWCEQRIFIKISMHWKASMFLPFILLLLFFTLNFGIKVIFLFFLLNIWK